MPATATTETADHRDVGDTWLLGVEVRNDLEPHELVNANVAVTVTRPDTSTATPTVVQDEAGRYHAGYVLAAPGRHFAVAAVSGAVVDVVTFAVDAETPGGPPTLAAVKTYLGTSVSSWSDAEITSALAAEQADQAKICRVGAVFPADLSEALKRRVARNLFLRGLPAGTQSAEGVISRVGLDSEIERLEGKYRRFVFA